MPQEIRLEVSRKLGRVNWKIDEFLKCIKDEVNARDNCSVTTEGVQKRNIVMPPEDEINEPYTIQTLMSSMQEIQNEIKNKNAHTEQKTNKKICLFCKDDHYSDLCNTVSDVSPGLEIRN